MREMDEEMEKMKKRRDAWPERQRAFNRARYASAFTYGPPLEHLNWYTNVPPPDSPLTKVPSAAPTSTTPPAPSETDPSMEAATDGVARVTLSDERRE